jgi:hypothetical protein
MNERFITLMAKTLETLTEELNMMYADCTSARIVFIEKRRMHYVALVDLDAGIVFPARQEEETHYYPVADCNIA